MACVTTEDFIKPVTKLTETKYTWISKGSFMLELQFSSN